MNQYPVYISAATGASGNYVTINELDAAISTCVPLAGTQSLFGNIIPSTGTVTLGSFADPFLAVYASNINAGSTGPTGPSGITSSSLYAYASTGLSGISTGTNLAFHTISSQAGTQITANSTGSLFTLAGGSSYQLQCNLGTTTLGSMSSLSCSFYDVTHGLTIPPSFGTNSPDYSSTVAADSSVVTSFTPSTTSTVAVQVTSLVGTVSNISNSTLGISLISGTLGGPTGATGSGGSAGVTGPMGYTGATGASITGPSGPSYNQSLNTSNAVQFSGLTVGSTSFDSLGDLTVGKTIRLSGTGVLGYTGSASNPGGIYVIGNPQLLQDTSTVASGTNSNAVSVYSLGMPQLGSTNSGVITTTASTLYIAGNPTGGTGAGLMPHTQTITNPYALTIDNSGTLALLASVGDPLLFQNNGGNGFMITAVGGLTINTTSSGYVYITGNLQSTNVVIAGTGLQVGGDGGGVALKTTFTNGTSTAAGAGSVTFKTNSGSNITQAGYMKAYVGTTAVYIPYFTSI